MSTKFTPKFVYDNFPDSDLLIPFEVTDDTTIADLEAQPYCDTLFLWLCRELCNPNDEIDKDTAIARCQSGIDDIRATMAAIATTPESTDDGAQENTGDQTEPTECGTDVSDHRRPGDHPS